MSFILDLFFPKRCCGCKKTGTYLCSKCKKEILQADLVCPNCERLSIGGSTHPLCKRKYGLDGLWSLGVYRGTLQKAIKKLKYKFVSSLAEDLIDLMIEYQAVKTPLFIDEIKKDKGIGWVVVPVPLHPKREKWRGFNQAALLGKIFAEKLGLDYQKRLERNRFTKPQVGLESWQRKNNISGAFSLSSNSKLLAPNYLLIDDVWTTGSTLKECCSVLKRNNAKKVLAITLAR
jgi:ComF family protein